MFNHIPPPPPQATLIICNKEIKIETCLHLKKKNVKEDLVLYKLINEEGDREYFGTCSLCYMEKISRKHDDGTKDD